MSSSSNSIQQKTKKFKLLLEPKQQQLVEQPTRNWLELPSDIMANILNRIGVFDILENAQKVCTAWRKICKDPAMWRVIHMDWFPNPNPNPNPRISLENMFKHAVDRSQGQLVDITISDFDGDELFMYVAERSCQLRHLEIICVYGNEYQRWTEALKKFPLLEELILYQPEISKEAIKTIGSYCPMLKTLRVNEVWGVSIEDADEESLMIGNGIAIAIGENLPELRHLQLIRNNMSNIGLEVILGNCCHLESLDLRHCFCIDLKGGDIGKRCSEQIKYVKWPNDPVYFEDMFGYTDDEY